MFYFSVICHILTAVEHCQNSHLYFKQAAVNSYNIDWSTTKFGLDKSTCRSSVEL